MKSFEKELPSGYELVGTLDPKSKKGKLIGYVGLIIIIIGLVVGTLLIQFNRIVDAMHTMKSGHVWITLSIYFVVLFLYIIVHELIHGLFYKIFTHQKLKFGMNGKVAYCGVPGIYVYRGPIIVILLAPCVILTIVFLTSIFLVPNYLIKFLLLVLLVIQFAGCIYDLYDVFLLLFKYQDHRTLIYDDGPTQKFYIPKGEQNEKI